MKRFKLLLLLFPLLLVNCLEEVCDPGPYLGQMKVRVSINDENPEVHVVIFRGKIEDHDTLISEYVSETPVYYELDAGNYYAVTARYFTGFREIVAVDGKRMETSTDDGGCESAEDLTINLKLAD